MKIHFIGIGGIGVSALAQYYLATGHQVSGSDLASSEIIELLRKKGAKIFIGKHNSKNLTKSTGAEKVKFLRVIYSPAVKEDNPELKEARRLGIACQSYPEALGELTKKYFTIAVAGAHGKSTTTAMLALILIKAGLDPTVIVGTKLKEFNNSNFRMGGNSKFKINPPGSKQKNSKLKILVIEACEHEASFLNYWPKTIVITNIDREHLDYYKNLNNILRAFRKFISHLPEDGILVVNWDDENIRRMLISNFQFLISKQIPKQPYGEQAAKSTLRGASSQINPTGSKQQKYFLRQPEFKKLKQILKVPGEHNVYNALAALTAARTLKVPDKISFQALSEYKGSWRRFEERQLTVNNQQLTIVSDYAHHPTEIKAVLKAAREKFPHSRICCVFQPHQHQRTFYLFKDFVRVFGQALKGNQIDALIITDIYDVAGREDEAVSKKISSQKLVEKINSSVRQKKQKALYLPGLRKVEAYIKENLASWEVLLIVGAGDIYQLSQTIGNLVPSRGKGCF